MGDRRSYTDRYAERVVEQVIHSDNANVARHQGLSEDIVWSMVEYVGEKSRYRRESVTAFGH
ncbi:transposase family protein [Leptolyngbya sp. CCNP1308]|uniref:transposase family protein n=1 Tax=Leptolyngbya sp. CCNP1308 TaxID=3110255 RepID=UPI003A599740